MGTRGRCSYCLREATTKDHVVPRCLLEKPYPPNLLTIPSCCECNTGFKQDEEYFLAVMAQSGFAPTLMSKVDENRAVDRMLQKSPGLDTLIQGSLHAAEDGRVYITPDEVRIANVVRKVYAAAASDAAGACGATPVARRSGSPAPRLRPRRDSSLTIRRSPAVSESSNSSLRLWFSPLVPACTAILFR